MTVKCTGMAYICGVLWNGKCFNLLESTHFGQTVIFQLVTVSQRCSEIEDITVYLAVFIWTDRHLPIGDGITRCSEVEWHWFDDLGDLASHTTVYIPECGDVVTVQVGESSICTVTIEYSVSIVRLQRNSK